jgi:hypothetical protein
MSVPVPALRRRWRDTARASVSVLSLSPEVRNVSRSSAGSGLAPVTIGWQRDADGWAQVMLMIKDDDDKDLVYPFEPVEAAATPAP